MTASNDCIDFQPIHPVGSAYIMLMDDETTIQILAEEIADHNEIWEDRCG